MDFTYFEAVLAFFGLASIVIGSFAAALGVICSESHRLHRPNVGADTHSK